MHAPGKGSMQGVRKGPQQPASAPPLLGARRPSHGPRPDLDDGVIEAWGAASSLPAGMGAAPGIIPLDIERDMWMSFAAMRQRRALRLAKIGIAAVRWELWEPLPKHHAAGVLLHQDF